MGDVSVRKVLMQRMEYAPVQPYRKRSLKACESSPGASAHRLAAMRPKDGEALAGADESWVSVKLAHGSNHRLHRVVAVWEGIEATRLAPQLLQPHAAKRPEVAVSAHSS